MGKDRMDEVKDGKTMHLLCISLGITTKNIVGFGNGIVWFDFYVFAILCLSQATRPCDLS